MHMVSDARSVLSVVGDVLGKETQPFGLARNRKCVARNRNEERLRCLVKAKAGQLMLIWGGIKFGIGGEVEHRLAGLAEIKNCCTQLGPLGVRALDLKLYIRGG